MAASALRVVGFVRARNEEDILEASLRHNLTVVDSLLVLDHGSDDATPQILAALVAEGLPIEVQREESLGLPAPATAIRWMEQLLDRGADVCIPLDADEFLRVPSRAAFDAVLRATDAAQPLALSVRTYVPAFDAPGDIAQRLRGARTVSGVSEASAKEVVRRAVAAHRSVAECPESTDNRADDRGGHMAPAIVSAALAMVARVPIRSAEQFAAKIALGHLVRALGDDSTPGMFRWQDEYAALMAGRPFTPARLEAIAAGYDLPAGHARDAQKAAWIEDPFLHDIRLSHTPALAPNPLARILAFGERVALAIAQKTGGL